MKHIWIICRREVNAFFDSLIAYIMLIVFLGLSGLFTWLVGSDIFLVGQASLGSFFSVAFWTLFFFIPAITMRMVAEEDSSGTMDLRVLFALFKKSEC
jgi:ABC-2 type transport system permease protein